MAFKAPKTIPGASPETNRALTAAFAELEKALVPLRDQYVDRRTRSNTYLPQAGQVVHLPDGKRQQLPDPRPYLASTITFVVERGTAELLGPVNRTANATLTGPGSFILTSTGDSWWLLGSATFGVSDEVAGEPGPTGPAGAAGLPGANGANGTPSPPGADGADGDPGPPGAPGKDGATGPAGPPGADGADGDPGPPGANGVAGLAGPPGPPGADGADGADGGPGPPGADGAPGATGPSGPAGPPGSDGADGNDGPPGAPGPAGATGATGATGPAGSAGSGLIASIDVNLGTVPLWSGTFDITGLAGLTPGDPVLVTRGVGPGGSGEAPDEAQESVGAAGVVLNSTTIRVQWEGINGPIAGTRRFYYAQLTGASGGDFTSIARADADADNANAILTVIPQFNWSQARVAWSTDFEGMAEQGMFSGMSPGGKMKVYKIPSEANHPGILRTVTQLGAGNIGYINLGGKSNESLYDPTTLLGFRAIVRLVTANPVTDYDVSIGFMSDVSTLSIATTVGDCIAVFTRSSGGSVWALTGQSSGAVSFDNGGAIVAGNWVVIEAFRPTGTTWEWFVNGTSQGTVSTNIPSSFQNFGLQVRDDAGGTTDFTVDIDYFGVFTSDLGNRFT